MLSAAELKDARDGSWVRIGGAVIVRQRPGTAKGFLFLTLEDETGTSNAIVRRVSTTSRALPPPGSTCRRSATSAMTPNFQANCTEVRLAPRQVYLMAPVAVSTSTSEPSATR